MLKAGSILFFVGIIISGGLTFYNTSLHSPYVPTHSSDLRLTGVVSANEVIVSSKLGGRIRRFHVDEGSWVKMDEPVCDLDREELASEVRSHQALISQLSARLKQATELVALEEQRTRNHIAKAEAQLQVAETEKIQAQSELKQMRMGLQRVRRMYDEGLISRQEWERAATEADVAKARLRSRDDRVRVSRADLDLASSNAAQVGLAFRDVEQTRALLEQQEALLSRAKARLRHTVVTAPLSGMVSLRIASQGEIVGPGNPIVTLVDLDDIWVRAAVEESYLSRVFVGQELRIVLASGKELRGRVTFVAPEAQFATQRDVNRVKRDIRTFGVKVRLDNPDRQVYPGMTAYVFLPSADRAN